MCSWHYLRCSYIQIIHLLSLNRNYLNSNSTAIQKLFDIHLSLTCPLNAFMYICIHVCIHVCNHECTRSRFPLASSLLFNTLFHREVIEAMTGRMPTVYGYSYCRCPPSHPRISLTNPLYCIENGAVSSSASPVSRLGTKSHPPEYLVNGGVIKPWISEMVENATVEIDLVYKELQVRLLRSALLLILQDVLLYCISKLVL